MKERSVYSKNMQDLVKSIEQRVRQKEEVSKWVKSTGKRPSNKKPTHTRIHEYLIEGGYADPKLQAAVAPFVPEAKKIVDNVLKLPYGKQVIGEVAISIAPELAVYVIAEYVMLSHIYDGEYMVVPKAKADVTKLKPGDTYWARVTVRKGKPPVIHEDDLS